MVVAAAARHAFNQPDTPFHEIFICDTSLVQLQILLISGFMYFTAFMEPDNVEAFNRREKRTPEASKLEQPATLLDELSEDGDSIPSESNKRRKRAAPYMIYPEILVIVDYDGYRLHGGDNLQVNWSFFYYGFLFIKSNECNCSGSKC